MKYIEKIVRTIVEEILDETIKDEDLDTDLEELGIDSLMAFEIEEKISEEFDIDFTSEDLAEWKTLRHAIELIKELKHEG